MSEEEGEQKQARRFFPSLKEEWKLSQTALGFDIYEKWADKTLNDWVQDLHLHLCKHKGWEYVPLVVGQFGYDDLASRITSALCYLFSASNQTAVTEDDIAHEVHWGFSENYVYWREKLPYESDIRFHPPHRPLGDAYRDKLASLKFADLSDHEKEKARGIARRIHAVYKDQLLTRLTGTE